MTNDRVISLGIVGILMGVSMTTSITYAQAQTNATVYERVNLNPSSGGLINPSLQEPFTLLREGRVLDAIKAFQAILRSYPQSLEAKLGLAIAYRRQGLIPEAWQAYQNVLAQDPNNQLALKSIGLLGTYKSEWQVKGIEALTTLLNLNPNDTEGRGLRALLYNYQQKFTEAIADYQIVLQTNPTPEVILGAAETYTNSGNPIRGLELFNRYLETGRTITKYAAIAYSRALRETGNPTAAVQILEAQLRTEASKLDDLGIQTRAALSRAYLASGQINQARAILVPLQGRADAVLPLVRSLNEIRNATNDFSLAATVANLYRQALAQTPNPDIRLLREVADVFSGLPQERQTALQIYRQLAASQPNDRTLVVKLLALESQLGLISKADLRARLYPVLQPLPTDPNELKQLGETLAGIDPPGPEFILVYRNLLASGIRVPFLNFRIAQLLLEVGDILGARTALATYAATPEGARDLAPQLLAAEIERREGNLEAAAIRYQGLIVSNRADSDVLNAALRGLSGIRVQQNRTVEAVAIFDQLVARNPQDLTLQLARASLAYRAKLIDESQGEAVLNYWLQTNSNAGTPPELFALVGTLPANSRREPLYNALIQIDPNNLPVQLRLLQVMQERNPAAARARVAQLVARDPNNIGSYFLQGELAKGIGELDIASKAYETILSALPYNLDALSALGGIRFQQRRFDSATELYSQALAIKPNDLDLRQTLISLTAASDKPMAALAALEVLQLEQIQKGVPNSDLSRQRQQIQEGFLQRRGFQPPWERF